MKYKNNVACLILTSLLTACGGGGGGSSDVAPTTTPTPTNNNVDSNCDLEVSSGGYTLITTEYDSNNDGCLSQGEIASAIAIEEALEEAELILRRTVDAAITREDVFEVNVTSASVVGNADAIDGRAQIYTNMLDGKFQLNFDIFPDLADDEYMIITFSNGTAAQVLGSIPDINISNEYIEVSNLSFFGAQLECTYSNSFNFDCEAGGVAIETINTGTLFNSIPAEANILIFLCQTGAGCYSNHATIPVSLN